MASTDDPDDPVLRLVRAGQIAEAMALYRAQRGVPLSAAVAAVDALLHSLPSGPIAPLPAPPVAPPTSPHAQPAPVAPQRPKSAPARPDPTPPAAVPASPGAQRPRTLMEAVDDAERQAIETALQACDGHREHAAEILGLSPVTLWRKMKRLRMC